MQVGGCTVTQKSSGDNASPSYIPRLILILARCLPPDRFGQQCNFSVATTKSAKKFNAIAHGLSHASWQTR